MSILIIDANTVSQAVPMNEAIEAMAVAFGQLSAGNVTMPVRTSLTTDKGMTLLMPCSAPNSDVTIKVVSVYQNNSALNLPTVTATVLVLDSNTGLPLALIEGNSLTAISTGATSSTPVFNGEDINLGTHITAIGAYTPTMQEIDAITVNQARIIVDHRESCLAEAGDLIIPNAMIDSEIGEIINGVKPKRTNDHEITLFKSVGVAIQDTFMANLILENALKKQLGIRVDL